MSRCPVCFAWESTERDQAVTLSYHNVVYMACFCGAFAVVVSTITLVIMMTITKRIIQLALFLTIALSFAWGTIGIGLSPRNFVPITGIIALALSVGYAFVVWDRIPFAASNLHAGLRAVRANMGTVLVAFVFQGIALGWTIYFTFVVIGVYDALDVGDLVLSQNMEVAVYALLGMSFYWTFHVLMVSPVSHRDTAILRTLTKCPASIEYCASDGCRHSWQLVVQAR
jgi:Plasma-membrane choline transporter